MSTNEADHLYDDLLDIIEPCSPKAYELLERLHELATPQAEELRQIRKFCLGNIKELIRILDYEAWELKQ